jgi:hypothetical protein
VHADSQSTFRALQRSILHLHDHSNTRDSLSAGMHDPLSPTSTLTSPPARSTRNQNLP